MVWAALVEMVQTEEADDKREQTARAGRLVSAGWDYTDSVGIDEESLWNLADTWNWVLEIGIQGTRFVEIRKGKSWKMNLYVHG